MGLDIIESAFAVKDGVKNVDFDCSSEFDANNDQAVTFLDGGSFLNIGDFDGKMSSRNGASFELDIKTSSMTAIVVYIPGAVTSPASFLAVEVLNGRVGLSTNDGGGVVVLMSDIIVNDGYWHRIRVIFSAAYMEVTVDGKTRTLSPSSSERKFYDLSDNLYFGGIEPNREFEALQQGLNSILSEGLEGSSLIGCLRRIEVNRHVTGLKEARNTRGLRSAGCGWDFVCLLHEPCIPEADCFQEGLDDFHCLCDLDTSCVRANFTRGRVQDGGSSSYGPVPGMRLDGGHNEKRNRKGKGRKKDRVNGSPRAHSPATTGRPTVTDQSPILDKVGPKFTLFDSLMNKEQLVMATVGVTITLVVILIVILFREFCFTGNRKSRQGSSGRTGTGTMSSPMPIESDFNDLATISSRQGMSSSHAASPAPSLETDSCLGSSNAGTGSAIRSLGSPGLFAARDERTGRLIVADRRQRESSVIYPLPPPSLYFGHEPNPISGTGSGHADHYCGYNQNSKPMSLFKPYSNNSNEPSCGTLGRHRPKPAYGQVQNGGHFQLAERALGDGVSSSTGSESQLPSLRRVPWSCEDLYRSHGQGSNQDGGYGPSDLECSSDVGKNSRTFAPINSRQQQQFEPIVPNHRTFQTFSPLTPMPAKRQHYWV
ncbi:Agrin [Halotydeus destructor]|nr:Agrin [Halotydeus destructor]